MKRRKFIKKSFFGAVGASIIGGIYSWQIEPFWLEFVRVKMTIKNLPIHLKGKTLMQISDIHVGNRFDYQYIIDSFKKAQKLTPDYVVYTGDFVSYDNKEQLKQLREVFKHVVKGQVGTLGNEQKNINGLNIIGLDDYWGLNFNPQKIMSQLNNEQANLVLCHNPDVCDLNVWNHYKGWILAGHTHGGQVKPPFLNPPILPVKNKKYSAGIIDLEDGRTLYINRALGHLLQVRFNVRPEITIFELE